MSNCRIKLWAELLYAGREEGVDVGEIERQVERMLDDVEDVSISVGRAAGSVSATLKRREYDSRTLDSTAMLIADWMDHFGYASNIRVNRRKVSVTEVDDE